ncbi:MAG: ABC transporter ATP-binding protein [Parvibaculum sp.]
MKQAKLRLNNVSVFYPVYTNEARSLRNLIVAFSTAGRIMSAASGPMIVSGMQNVSITLYPGDRVGLIGANGAGKTTLLKTLAGIYQPSEGEIDVNGNIESLLEIGLGMDEESSGVQNIYLSNYLRGRKKSEVDAIVDDVVSFADIGDFIHMPIRTYSSGMRMRLAFAIATAINPDIMLIDEVFSVGDSSFVDKAKNRIESLISKANVMVFASHSDALLRQFCNKGLFMKSGRVEFFGDFEEAVNMYNTDANLST